MGDADSTQHMMPVEEIETWMDGALSEMDDGLDSLFALMHALNRRTHKVSAEVSSWHRLKDCFTALNIFVIPVVLAIWIACAANEYTGLDKSGEGFLSAVLQAVGIILMFVSGVIGLPFYVCKTLQMYYLENNEATAIPSKSESETIVDGCFENDGTLARELVESFSEIRRITTRRFIDSVRRDIERRVEQATGQAEETSERSFESLASRSETFDTSKMVEIQLPEQQQSGREDSGFTESSVVEREFGDFRGLKLTILSHRPDVTVEIEGENNDTNHTQHQQQPIVTSNPVRNIEVENLFGL